MFGWRSYQNKSQCFKAIHTDMKPCLVGGHIKTSHSQSYINRNSSIEYQYSLPNVLICGFINKNNLCLLLCIMKTSSGFVYIVLQKLPR